MIHQQLRISRLPTHTYTLEDWDIWARLGETGEKVAFAKEAHLTTDDQATLKEHWKHQVRWWRTYLNGMWEQRERLVKQSKDFFRNLHGYLMAIELVIILPCCLVTALI